VILGLVALFHSHGLGNALLASVRSGATLVLLPSFQRDAVLAAIGREQVSVFPSVPFICQTLAETRRAERAETGSLRLCFTAGAPLARETFDLWAARFGVPLRQLYGCSEAGSVTINLDDDVAATAASSGRPMKGIELTVVRPDGEPCRAGRERRGQLQQPRGHDPLRGPEPGGQRGLVRGRLVPHR
jgi:long-chain acyl-CoA synthetase